MNAMPSAAAIKGVCEDLKFSELTVNLFGEPAPTDVLVTGAYCELFLAVLGT